MKTQLILAFWLVFSMCSSAQAVSFTYTFSGSITDVDHFLASGDDDNFSELDFLCIGTPFVGIMHYEYQNLLKKNEGQHNYYYLQGYISMVFGGSLYISDNSQKISMQIVNGENSDLLYDNLGKFINGVYKNYYYSGELLYTFYDATGTAFNSSLVENLPILDSSLFSNMNTYVWLEKDSSAFAIKGNIDTLKPVPEASTIICLSLGLAAIFFHRRKYLIV